MGKYIVKRILLMFLTLFIIPIAYLLLARHQKSPHQIQREIEKLDRENPVSVE